MRVFVTGASGWIGSQAVPELLGAGHEVLGLARSDASAEALERAGAKVLRGDLDDLDSLRRGAEQTDGTVHLANKHDWANPAASNAAERAAVETIGEVLTGSDRPFVLASGVAGLGDGRPATEGDVSTAVGPDSARGGAENRALELVDRGVRVVPVRFAPTVHGRRDHGFVSFLVATARERGVSGWIDDGTHRWAAVHRTDAARLVRLGLESAAPGTVMHAVDEEGVPTREIAEAIGRVLGLPTTSVARDDAQQHFGFLARFFGTDLAATSARTREVTGWEPAGPTLVADIEAGAYTDA